MTADDITTPDISIRDLEQRWGLSRNGLKARAKALGVELVRVSSTCTVWPGDYIELGDRLHEHVSAGNPLGTFPGLAPDRSDTTAASSAISKKEQDTAALVAAIASAMGQQQSQPSDPLALAKRLADAAQLGVPLTNAEMAAVLGRASVSPKHNGTSPRPGFTLERIEHNGTPFWMVHRSGAPTAISASSQASQPQGRQVGFTAASMAVIDVQAGDCTGSDLFSRMTLR